MSAKVQILFRVVSRDERGRPRELVAVYDTERIKLEGGEHFLTALVDKASVAPKIPGDDPAARADVKARRARAGG